ncbi:MAG: galactose mutarotase [Clostridia bacterium]|nr:galactose mutarotase [Clostridia bacterium]
MTSNGVFMYKVGRQDVRLYHLTNGVISADILNMGGAIVRLLVPDKNGKKADIILGFRSMQEYSSNRCHFGCLIGRFANRIANGYFELNGKRYDLVNNNMGYPGTIHGGIDGWHLKVWDVIEEETDDRRLTMAYHSPDMENGFPGNVDVKMVYSITDRNGLSLEYFAKSDKDTYVNMTNHSSFNMAGHGSGSILDHIVTINADYITPADEASIPTGELRPVKGTAFDFTSPKPIGQDIRADDEQLKLAGGYDHNFCIKGEGYRWCATVEDPKEGRVMTCYTTCPGVQFFTTNGVSFAFQDSVGKDGVQYKNNAGFCLETQYYPDSPNKPQFPSNLLKAGEEYYEQTVYEFTCK